MQDLLNIPRQIEFEGVTYELREPSIEEEGRLSVWLETQARDAVRRDLTKTDAERERADNQITRDVAAGVYEPGGPVAIEALQSYRGCAKLVAIILKIDDGLALRMFKAKAMEIAQLLGRATDSGDPKQEAAARELLKRLGLPSTFASKSFSRNSGRKPTSRSSNSRGGKSSRGTRG